MLLYWSRNAVLVAIKPWFLQHRVFVHNTFIVTGRSDIQTQRRFQNHFNVGRHGGAPKFETIMQ